MVMAPLERQVVLTETTERNVRATKMMKGLEYFPYEDKPRWRKEGSREILKQPSST